MSAREVAQLFGVYTETIKRIPPADLPYMRLGNRGDRKYRRIDVDAYIARRMVDE